jgi:hypothetical protein
MDDTNVLAWGDSAAVNYRALSEVYIRCEEWATRHGVRFEPSKY